MIHNYTSMPLVSTHCGYSDEINGQTIFWIEGVFLSLIGWIGVLGNIVTFHVLSKIPSKHNIFNKLLMQLLSGDSLSIILLFLDYSLRKSFHLFSLEDILYGYMWPKIIYPFIKISDTWIMCCTMAITIERYNDLFVHFEMLKIDRVFIEKQCNSLDTYLAIYHRYLAICHPFLVNRDADEIWTRGSLSRRDLLKSLRHIEPSRKRLYRYTFVVLLISVLSNIPSFFEFESVLDMDTQSRRIKVTSLRVDKHYIFFYKNVFEGIVLMILPLIAMVCLNARIIFTLNQRGRTIICGLGRFKRIRNEMNLGRVLVSMDVVFLFCNLGRAIINVWEIFHIGQLKECLEVGLPYKVSIYK